MTRNTTNTHVPPIRWVPWQESHARVVSFAPYHTPWGRVYIATTTQGVCAVVFAATDADATQQLHLHYPRAILRTRPTALQRRAHAAIVTPHRHRRVPIPVQVRGTSFQMRVWRALCAVPCGATVSYGALARLAGHAGGARAVGSAMAKNPVALLVPCHRVVRSDGAEGQYAYGTARKKRILQWEKTHYERASLGDARMSARTTVYSST